MAQQSEHSPLLPRLVLPATSLYHSADEKAAAAALPGEPQRSFLGGSQTIRHRKKSRSQLPVRRAHDNDDDDDGNEREDDDDYSDRSDGSDDGADSTDLEEVNWADRNVDGNDEYAKRAVADRNFQQQQHLRSKSPIGSSGNGTAALLPLGLAKRKPRWLGLRNKLAAASGLESCAALTPCITF